jgi:hypothetical protein
LHELSALHVLNEHMPGQTAPHNNTTGFLFDQLSGEANSRYMGQMTHARAIGHQRDS